MPVGQPFLDTSWQPNGTTKLSQREREWEGGGDRQTDRQTETQRESRANQRFRTAWDREIYKFDSQ